MRMCAAPTVLLGALQGARVLGQVVCVVARLAVQRHVRRGGQVPYGRVGCQRASDANLGGLKQGGRVWVERSGTERAERRGVAATRARGREPGTRGGKRARRALRPAWGLP